MNMKRRLGVNIDHIATLREARKEWYPDPLESLAILKKCGARQVTLHLREDRRHIKDHDLKRIVAARVLPVNLEMAVTDEMVGLAAKSGVVTCTFVPEKRQEITTEGGLDVKNNFKHVARAVQKLKKAGKQVSLFIDPETGQLEAALKSGADAVEFHTGTYCRLMEKYFTHAGNYRWQAKGRLGQQILRALEKLRELSCLTVVGGMKAYAGHGLHVYNLPPVVRIPEIEEYNIGHAIVARAVFVGLANAVLEIQKILGNASC